MRRLFNGRLATSQEGTKSLRIPQGRAGNRYAGVRLSIAITWLIGADSGTCYTSLSNRCRTQAYQPTQDTGGSTMTALEGVCLWDVNGEPCGDEAVDVVKVRDRTGTATVPVCVKHRAEHNRKAAKLRVRS